MNARPTYHDFLERMKGGALAPAVPETAVPELGATLLRGPGGAEVAVFHGDTIHARRERWPLRLHGRELEGKWPEVDGFGKGQRDTYDALLGLEGKPPKPTALRDAILCGPTGRGKTMVAVRALRDLWVLHGVHTQGWDWEEVKRRCEPRWLDHHESTEDNQLEAFERPTVLLLDDVGFGDSGHSATDHEKRVLLSLIKRRGAEGRHTWITSNLDETALLTYGEAAISRLREHAHVKNFRALRNYRLPPGAERAQQQGET